MISCKCIEDCLDAQTPERRNTKLQQWASADAQFLRNLSIKKKERGQEVISHPPSSIQSQSSPCHEAYAPRQTYLRSYPLGKNAESVKKHKHKPKSSIQSVDKNASSTSSAPSRNLITRVLRFFLVYTCFAKVQVNEAQNSSAVAPVSFSSS